MKFRKPALNQTFTITSAPEWPSIDCATDARGIHTWHWTIAWDTFKKSGKETTAGNAWDAKAVITNCGGTLTVRAEANGAAATITVKIKGSNPSVTQVSQYLATKANSTGFDKIIGHESKFKHFDANNEPKKSFDKGYGMCQLTNPPPPFEQVWNWKLNIDGGLKLYGEKLTAAIAYLSQHGRT